MIRQTDRVRHKMDKKKKIGPGLQFHWHHTGIKMAYTVLARGGRGWGVEHPQPRNTEQSEDRNNMETM